MILTRQDLEREAAATGFAAETLEKAIRLLGLLGALVDYEGVSSGMSSSDTSGGRSGNHVPPPPGLFCACDDPSAARTFLRLGGYTPGLLV